MNIAHRYRGVVTWEDLYPPILGKAIRFVKRKLNIAVPESCYNNYYLHPLLIAQAAKVKSSSQYCEDLILDVLLNFKEKGMYIDVGAYDPCVFSNTKRFYERGWSGINIEPDPENYRKFVEQRGRDINLNMGVGAANTEKDFYRLSADTLSTFSEDIKNKNVKEGHTLVSKQKIPVRPLTDIFSKYANEVDVDFMSIDVEGSELEVIQSNDWAKYRPRVIVVEINRNRRRLLAYLSMLHYRIVFNNQTNAVFIDSIFSSSRRRAEAR